MANIKEHYLQELKVHYPFLEDSLKAILHTIMFVRAPQEIKGQDRACEVLCPLIYPTVGPSDVDRDIRGTIDQLKRELTASGLSFRKEILLSFFEHREVKEWMGLVNRTETIYFERWHIPITILTNATSTPSAASTSSKAPKSTLGTVFPDIDDLSESYDHDKAFRSAYDQVTKSIFSIIESVNHSTDHMPLSQYQYELQVLDAEESRRRSSASFSNKGPI